MQKGNVYRFAYERKESTKKEKKYSHRTHHLCHRHPQCRQYNTAMPLE